jgi:amidase
LTLTIDKAADGLEAGHFTPVDRTKAYLARIEESSEFNAVLQVNSDAVTVARELDE